MPGDLWLKRMDAREGVVVALLMIERPKTDTRPSADEERLDERGWADGRMDTRARDAQIQSLVGERKKSGTAHKARRSQTRMDGLGVQSQARRAKGQRRMYGYVWCLTVRSIEGRECVCAVG